MIESLLQTPQQPPLDEPHSKDPKQLDHRYEGIAKVTGKAKYSAEFSVPNQRMAYGYIVGSTIAAGTVASIDRSAAERAPGVLVVMTFENAPKVPPPLNQPPTRRRITLLQDNKVDYSDQPVAYIVAESLDQARYAASLLKIRYTPATPKLHFHDRLNEGRSPSAGGREPNEVKRGDLAQAMQQSSARLDETYTTPIQHANPMEPHATIAWWDGDKLSVYDATQAVSNGKATLARTLAIPTDTVTYECPFTGGGFGSKGSQWSHVALTAMAARVSKRPVKLALDRDQMFGNVGARPETVQRIQLGARGSGANAKLLGLSHEVILSTSTMADFLESSANQSRYLYATQANLTSHKLVDTSLGVFTYHRAPGESSGTAALEQAIDELCYRLQIDPVQFRINSHAENDQSQNKPWTSKHLKECYRQAAERFGWARKFKLQPGTVRDGNELVGYGMATAIYGANRSPAQATVRLMPDGTGWVGSGSQDLGTGTYTIMAQTAADGLGLDPTQVVVKLGDGTLPRSPVSGGSQTAASLCPAITDGAGQVKLALLEMARLDPQSPLHNMPPEQLDLRNGRVISKSNPAIGEPYAALIARNGGKPIEGKGSAEPDETAKSFSAHSWGAVFAEVGVDVDTHMPRVRNIVATYDIGTLMNEKTGINQLQGGIVWAIAFALHEDTHLDQTYGRYVNRNLAEYHVPVNADVPDLDVTVLGIPDTKFNPLGARGIGEIGITGAAAAIANAIYNATGIRVRDYPITPDKLMKA
jgi:xanthine dehydrogenase YagR molybdenum-binding subunit